MDAFDALAAFGDLQKDVLPAVGDMIAAMSDGDDSADAAMSQGKLTGLAFTNMAGTNVRMIKALVDGINEVNPALGATINNLQDLINNGKITTPLMIPALRTQIDKLSKEVVDMPVSMADTMNVLRDSLARVSLELERQTGVVRKLTKAIEWTTDNLKHVLRTLIRICSHVTLMDGHRIKLG